MPTYELLRFDQLTIISLIMVCLSKFLYKYINLLFITIFVCFAGLYVSYTTLTYEKSSHLYPGIDVKEFNIAKFYIDILLHVLPVLYIYINYKDYYKSFPSSETAIILIVIYICSVKVESVYNINDDKHTIILGIIFTTMIIIYLSIYR